MFAYTNAFSVSEPSIIIISPDDEEVIEDIMPQVSVMFEGQVDVTTVKIKVDGVDVTPQCDIAPEYLLYVPQMAMSEGSHQVIVTAKDTWGQDIMPAVWVFITVIRLEGEGAVVSDTETVSFEGELGGVEDTKQSVGMVNGTLSVGWQNAWTDNTQADYYTVTLSTLVAMDSYFYGQILGVNFSGWYNRNQEYKPYEQFAIDVYSDYLDLTAGYFFPYFSELSLNDFNALGSKAYIKIGETKLGLVGARIREPEEGTEEGWGTYARYVTGVKPEFEFGENLLVSLIYVRAWDEISSLKTPGYAVPIKGSTVELFTNYTMLEKYNLVAELSSNEYYENALLSNARPLTDSAWVVSFGAVLDSGKVNLGYRRVGSNYYPVASSMIESDRMGPEFSAEYTIPGIFTTVSAETDYYQNLVSTTYAKAYRDDYKTYYVRAYLNVPEKPSLSISWRDTVYFNEQRNVSTTLNFGFFNNKLNYSVSASQSSSYADNIETVYQNINAYFSVKMLDGKLLPSVSYNYYKGFTKSVPVTYEKVQNTRTVEVAYNIFNGHTLTLKYFNVYSVDEVTFANTNLEEVVYAKYSFNF
ncbi:MAG: hypothetical protein WC955_03680 [Elusimicrobiota bacterium]